MISTLHVARLKAWGAHGFTATGVVLAFLATLALLCAAALGIWSDPYYRVRRAAKPADFSSLSGHYELVEGRVLSAGKSGSRVYLNFGRHYKEDFTAVIEARALKLFGEAGLDPLKLGNALVRVRGWIDLKDGPRIEITHPEQIEVLAVP